MTFLLDIMSNSEVIYSISGNCVDLYNTMPFYVKLENVDFGIMGREDELDPNQSSIDREG